MYSFIRCANITIKLLHCYFCLMFLTYCAYSPACLAVTPENDVLLFLVVVIVREFHYWFLV